MVQNLILPSTWADWTWEKSNGSATDDQTIASHDVLVNAGQCVDFSRFVWNDIVDTLANALAAVGVEWDSKYCTAEECKINEHLGVLMAYAWNSVTWNIRRFNFFKWKWERANYMPGYVGRNYFNGYSTHGDSADNLFAWYLLELTGKLNKLILVLKDQADFANFDTSNYSTSNIKVKLSAPKLESASSILVSESDIVSRFVSIPVIPTKGIGIGYSYQNGILLPVETTRFRVSGRVETHSLAQPKIMAIDRLHTDANSETHCAVYPKILGIGRLRTDENSETRPIAHAKSLGVDAMKNGIKSKSITVSSITPLSLIHSKADIFVNSYYVASPYVLQIEKHSYSGKGESKVDSVINALELDWLRVVPEAETKTDANLWSGNPAYPETVNMAKTADDARSMDLPSLRLVASAKSESGLSGVVNIRESKPLGGFGVGSSKVLSKPKSKPSNAFRIAVQAVSNVVASLDFWKKVFEWVDPIQTGSNLYIQCVYSSWREGEKCYIDVAVWYDPKKDGNDLYIQSAYQFYADGDKAYIDTGVYYEPIQTGNDLFIRSAASMKGVIDDG